MRTKKRGRRGPHTISGDRIELLCHTINRVASEMSWFHTGPQEFYWAVEAALEASGLPDSWIKAALAPGMTVEYQKCFQANGYCLDPTNLKSLEKIINAKETT